MIDEKKLIEDILQHENVLASANHVYKSGYRDRQYEIIDTIKRQPKVGEWILCSERLPERNGTYLVTICSYDETANINYMAVEHGNSNGSFLHYETQKPRTKKGEYIVAWMSLPEPYKGELE